VSKFCQFLPHQSEVHEQDGVNRCHDLQERLDRHPEFFSKIIASDGNKRKEI
jgi:hypothetical protein